MLAARQGRARRQGMLGAAQAAGTRGYKLGRLLAQGRGPAMDLGGICGLMRRRLTKISIFVGTEPGCCIPAMPLMNTSIRGHTRLGSGRRRSFF